jgi:hypothetical protein
VLELAEAAHAAGNRIAAVALWRQAFLQLPPAEEFDEVRQTLVLRIGHGLLELNRRDGDDYHLRAAKQMLDRWLAARDPDRVHPADLRELYAVLGEVELRMQQPVERGAGSVEREAGFAMRDRALDQLNYSVLAARLPADHAGEIFDSSGQRRTIVVDPNDKSARLSDPRVRDFLRHPSPEGASLLDGGDMPLNPTRPLVRAGHPRTSAAPEGMRGLAWSESWRLVRELRPQLEQCYAMSFARMPLTVVRQRVGLRAAEDGTVLVEEQSGDPLGDRAGDLCVIRVFAGATVDPSLAGTRFAEIPFTFFLQLEQYIRPPGIGGGMGMGASMMEYAGDRATETSFGVGAGQRQQ